MILQAVSLLPACRYSTKLYFWGLKILMIIWPIFFQNMELLFSKQRNGGSTILIFWRQMIWKVLGKALCLQLAVSMDCVTAVEVFVSWLYMLGNFSILCILHETCFEYTNSSFTQRNEGLMFYTQKIKGFNSIKEITLCKYDLYYTVPHTWIDESIYIFANTRLLKSLPLNCLNETLVSLLYETRKYLFVHIGS